MFTVPVRQEMDTFKCQLYTIQHHSQINRIIQVLLRTYYLSGTIPVQFTHSWEKKTGMQGASSSAKHYCDTTYPTVGGRGPVCIRHLCVSGSFPGQLTPYVEWRTHSCISHLGKPSQALSSGTCHTLIQSNITHLQGGENTQAWAPSMTGTAQVQHTHM